MRNNNSKPKTPNEKITKKRKKLNNSKVIITSKKSNINRANKVTKSISKKINKSKEDYLINGHAQSSEGLISLVLKDIIKSIKIKTKNFSLVQIIKYFFYYDFRIKVLSFLIALSIFGYVKMQDIEERRIFVNLEVIKNEELAFVNNPPENITLFLSGTRNILAELDINQIKGKIDLTDIKREGEYQRTPTIEGIPKNIQIINFSPQEINFQLSSLEKKLLEIEPEFIGEPNSDYEIKGFKTVPRKIWILGPSDILQDMTKITTEPISVKGIKINKEIEVELSKNIHPNIKVDLQRKIKVNILIFSKYYKETLKSNYPLKIHFSKDKGLISYNYIEISNIEYRIPIKNSEEFDPDVKIQFFVDTSKINFPGEYNLSVNYQKEEGLKILKFNPNEVKLSVKVFNHENDKQKEGNNIQN